MTNKEAIQFLSQIMDAILVSNSWLPSTDNPIKESFGMAINALQAQESCNKLATNLQPSKQDADDLISRAAAIDEAEEWIEVVYCEDGDQRERDAIGHVIHGIKELPSVQTCEDAVSKGVGYRNGKRSTGTT